MRFRPNKSAGLAGVPSWSWVSCNAYATWDFLQVPSPEDLNATDDSITVLACDVTWKGLPYVSDIQSSTVILKGHLRQLSLRIAPENWSNPPYFELESERLDLPIAMPWC
jgi:hypothetical protein